MPLETGDEVDAFCTRCKLDLGHRIVAMVGHVVKRVVCSTCGSQHNYRAPKSATKRKAVGSPRKTGTARRPNAKGGVAELAKQWQTMVHGKPHTDFTTYSMDGSFAEQQLVSHKKFGQGFVVSNRESGKVSIMFRDGTKTLAARGS